MVCIRGTSEEAFISEHYTRWCDKRGGFGYSSMISAML
jgi:hypothetical protein